MLENLLSSELKIKILRLLNQEGTLRFSYIKNTLKTGAGSTKSALESLVEEGVLNVKVLGKKQKYFYITKDYKDILNQIFELEKKEINLRDKAKLYKNFFNIGD